MTSLPKTSLSVSTRPPLAMTSLPISVPSWWIPTLALPPNPYRTAFPLSSASAGDAYTGRKEEEEEEEDDQFRIYEGTPLECIHR